MEKGKTNLKSVDGKGWICSTCKTTVSSGKVSKLAVINGMATKSRRTFYDSDAEEVAQENVGNTDTMVQDANEKKIGIACLLLLQEKANSFQVFIKTKILNIFALRLFCGKRRKEHEKR